MKISWSYRNIVTLILPTLTMLALVQVLIFTSSVRISIFRIVIMANWDLI